MKMLFIVFPVQLYWIY